MTFSNLNISEPILKALATEGYTKPTPIQVEAIPPLLEGRDLLGCAQTGTGKTAAFAIPILQKLQNEKTGGVKKAPHALILTPTRELAAQIGHSFSGYGRFLRLKNTVIYGGVSQNPQVQALKAGVDILVATPGRLIDLMNQKQINLKHIRFFVLDEADRMLDMGFLRDVERIIKELPDIKQTMLFSATMPGEIEKLTKTLLKQPVKVEVTPAASTVDSIDQSIYLVNKCNKAKLLLHLLENSDIVSALVFTRTKHAANKLAYTLLNKGVTCEVIHSNKSQTARKLALSHFKVGKARVMVATDIVSRGIDIAELSHVINFNLPESPEDYVHRIGRTGRAGHAGKAISFCDNSEAYFLLGIEKLIGKKIKILADHPYPLQYVPEEMNPERRPVARTNRTRGSKNNGSTRAVKRRGSGYGLKKQPNNNQRNTAKP